MERMSAPGPSLTEAYAVLGLHGPCEAADLTRAFRVAVKDARPDMTGGDAERFRRIIAAYRLIQATGRRPAALAAPQLRPAVLPVVGISPLQAVAGCETTVRLGDRSLRVRVPAGLRTGEHLRLKGAADDASELYLQVLIRPEDGLTALGDDLYMTWPVPPRLLGDGGRVEIETYAGMRAGWVAPGLTDPVRLRLRDLGLPARGSRPQGHLFVALQPSEDAPSAAEDLLARFARVWTPDRLAA
jgi:curved DNA-binding protein